MLGTAFEVHYNYYPWNQQGGRLQSIVSETRQNLAYTYDPAGNITQIVDGIANQTQSFSYDLADRLISASATGGTDGQYSEVYTYNTTTGNLASKASQTYAYDPLHPHAVSSLGNNTYSYDANGNQTTRVIGTDTFTLYYDAENHLVEVKKNGATFASFTYDGDGKRVQSTINGVSTTFVGNYYEVSGSAVTKYYYAGSGRVAMREGGELYFLLGDHLGSTSLTTDASGGVVSEMRYTAWGSVRYQSGTAQSEYTFTGQYSNMSSIGLMFYNARWYDPELAHMTQADSLIPEPGNSQAWDRYAYAENAPIVLTDPTGHWTVLGILILGTVIAGGIIAYDVFTTPPTKAERAPSPTSNDVNSWVADRVNETATSPVMQALKNNWDSANVLNKAGALKAWAGLVTEKGIWDYKSDLLRGDIVSPKGNIIFGESKENFQSVANATYGMYAAEMGLPQWLAEAGAGAAQLMQDPNTSGGFKTYGDDPADSYWVKFGYWFEEEYESQFGELTKDDLISGIETYEELYGVPPDPLASGR